MRLFRWREFLKPRYIDEYDPENFWSIRNFNCNYFKNPGSIGHKKLVPHAFQTARRLRTFLRRKCTCVVYKVENQNTTDTIPNIQYWVKDVGAPMYVRRWAVQGMSRWRRWTWWIQSVDRVAIEWRERNDYTLVTNCPPSELPDID